MNEVLARIRVRETAGIRRFLYPVELELSLPLSLQAEPQRTQLSLTDSKGRAVFFERSPINLKEMNNLLAREKLTPATLHTYIFPWMLWFAVFLEPLEEAEFTLNLDGVRTKLDDPLQLYVPETGALLSSVPDETVTSIQKRVTTSITDDGKIAQVTYDGVTHLRGPLTVTPVEAEGSASENTWDFNLLGAWTQRKSSCNENGVSITRVQITACKSWATVTHTLEQPKPGDEITFALPLAITSPTLTCDFGVGGYVFGKLDEKATEIVWHTEFGDAPYAKWTVATAGRVDYVGEVTTADEFRSQRWFHLIDSDKALAVAITFLPDDCRELTVRLTHDGDVSVAFKLGEAVTEHPEEHIEFGVCYHFLNDVPAIAAATNPQSILLPPVVEVL